MNDPSIPWELTILDGAPLVAAEQGLGRLVAEDIDGRFYMSHVDKAFACDVTAQPPRKEPQ